MLAPCVNSHGIERKEWSLIYILGNVTGPTDDEEGAAEGRGGPLTLTSLPQGASQNRDRGPPDPHPQGCSMAESLLYDFGVYIE